ncbi:MAG: NUDIX hydrolase [Halobacteriaceae archaeon]
MSVDDLWFLASRAEQRARQTYHRLDERYGAAVEFEHTHHVSRSRFRELARRVRACGAPYGAQTLVHDDGAVLLVRHEGVDRWVLPGGGVDGDEAPLAAARRELREEAGIAAEYDGLAWVTRVRFRHDGRSAWGVLPVFEATPATGDPTLSVRDPDGEISAARWFADLPPDTRDRSHIRAWLSRAQG